MCDVMSSSGVVVSVCGTWCVAWDGFFVPCPFCFWLFGFWFLGFFLVFWFVVAYSTQLLSQAMYKLMMATTMAETCSC